MNGEKQIPSCKGINGKRGREGAENDAKEEKKVRARCRQRE